MVRLGDIIGTKLEEEFLEFDLTEVQELLSRLRETDPIDLAHAEFLQQQSLRAADLLSEFLGKIVKTIGCLEAQVNSKKNKAALDYKSPDGSRTTVEMKKWYGECAPEVEETQIKLAKAKASKMVIEKKYDILIKLHHHEKDIANGIRRSINVGYQNNDAPNNEKIPMGYE